MRRLAVLGLMAFVLAASGCTTTERYVVGGAAIGGLGGAAIGAGLSGTPQGALVGGAIGAAGGAVVGGTIAPPEHVYFPTRRPGKLARLEPAYQPVRCSYVDAYGRRFISHCPVARR